MPEATANINDRLVEGQHYAKLAQKLLHLQSETKAVFPKPDGK